MAGDDFTSHPSIANKTFMPAHTICARASNENA